MIRTMSVMEACVCRSCGHQMIRWSARCPACGKFIIPGKAAPEINASPRMPSIDASIREAEAEVHAKPARAIRSVPEAESKEPVDLTDDESDIVQICDLSAVDQDRRLTGIEPLDRVLGGGLVVGSSILVSGGPGNGKSTLLSQMANSVRKTDGSPCDVVLWASGEEPQSHIAMRAKRLGIAESKVKTYAQKWDVDRTIAHARKMNAEVLIVDSIQAFVTADLPSVAGSVQQVKECARRYDQFAKETGCSVVIICQVTKSGQSAGPKTLEHLVDATFSIEPIDDEYPTLRVLQAQKNRFGAVTEIGTFEMTSTGMIPVDNPEPAKKKQRNDEMIPIAQELLHRLLDLGEVIDEGLRDRIAGRLDLTLRGAR